MRYVDYECDLCQRMYHYEIKAEESERGILLKIPSLKIEVCNQCKKKLLEAIATLKNYVRSNKG